MTTNEPEKKRAHPKVAFLLRSFLKSSLKSPFCFGERKKEKNKREREKRILLSLSLLLERRRYREEEERRKKEKKKKEKEERRIVCARVDERMDG